MTSIYTTYSDGELLQFLKDGDEKAFAELFLRYREAALATAFHLLKSNELAEDVLQEVFMQLWKGSDKAFMIEDIRSWLFIATRNHSLKKFRRIQLERSYTDYLTETVDSISSTNLVEFKELQASIEKAIISLPPQQQTAFRLSREKGLTHAQVADEMNISHRTASDHILKAIYHIRWFLHQRAALSLVTFLGLF